MDPSRVDCAYAAKASAYHDRELSEAEGLLFEEHLAGCSACRGELEEILRLAGVIRRSAARGELSGTALARLHEIAEGDGEFELFPAVRLLAGVSTVLLVISLSLSLFADGRNGAARSSTPEWEDLATAREPDAEMLEEPEIELTQWVVAGLTER